MLETTLATDATFQMWAMFAFIIAAFALYATEKFPMEVTSVGIICVLLIFFQIFPVIDQDGTNLLGVDRIIHGFSNPALIAVVSLLIIGQGMVRTGVLDRGAKIVMDLGRGVPWLSIAIILLVAIAVSAFLNNIPVVVILIPVMQAMADRFNRSASKVMIPLSFAAVLGGMTTLIGSGTNLLVIDAMAEMSVKPFNFFDFTVPGLILAAVGLVYLLVVAPRLLPERASLADTLFEGGGKQFISQITISADSKLIGTGAPGGLFVGLPEMTVRMVQRGEEGILPPFEDYVARPGDMLVVAATRNALTEALAKDHGLLFPNLQDGHLPDDDQPWHEGERMQAEVMVAPASRMIGQTLTQIGFRYKTGCIVLGLQRRSRMIRSRMIDIRLRAGDVLLIQGQSGAINELKRSRDVVLIEWSAKALPALDNVRTATLIFAAVVGLSVFGLVPIVVAAFSGAAAMVALGVLNVRQAIRAVDPLVVSTIVAALAMGAALKGTGGALFLADAMVSILGGVSPAIVLSLFFLFIAVLSNIISTKATAVLFTPVAIEIALEIGAPPEAFAVAMVFAANCSFASPLGYQTNLLVMGPGHYKFTDYARVGIPLIILMWITFSIVAPWYYGI